MNIPNDAYHSGQPAFPVKVKKTDKGDYEVTSTHFPGKSWRGKDEQSAMKSHVAEIRALHGAKEIHKVANQPKAFIEEKAKKTDKNLRKPEKAVQDEKSVNVAPARKLGRSATGMETPIKPEHFIKK